MVVFNIPSIVAVQCRTSRFQIFYTPRSQIWSHSKFQLWLHFKDLNMENVAALQSFKMWWHLIQISNMGALESSSKIQIWSLFTEFRI